MLIDPLTHLVVRFLFAGLFLAAAAHKLSARMDFANILRGYALLPESLVGLFAVSIPAVELLIAAVLIVRPDIGVLLAVGLLGMYALIMLSAILRGKADIDCGCAWGAAKTEGGRIGAGHIVRNVVLIGAVLIATLPASDRALGVFDFANAIAFVLVAGLLLVAWRQLQAISALRKKVAS